VVAVLLVVALMCILVSLVTCDILNCCVGGFSVLHFTKIDRNRRHIESIDIKCDVKSIVEGALSDKPSYSSI